MAAVVGSSSGMFSSANKRARSSAFGAVSGQWSETPTAPRAGPAAKRRKMKRSSTADFELLDLLAQPEHEPSPTASPATTPPSSPPPSSPTPMDEPQPQPQSRSQSQAPRGLSQSQAARARQQNLQLQMRLQQQQQQWRLQQLQARAHLDTVAKSLGTQLVDLHALTLRCAPAGAPLGAPSKPVVTPPAIALGAGAKQPATLVAPAAAPVAPPPCAAARRQPVSSTTSNLACTCGKLFSAGTYTTDDVFAHAQVCSGHVADDPKAKPAQKKPAVVDLCKGDGAVRPPNLNMAGGTMSPQQVQQQQQLLRMQAQMRLHAMQQMQMMMMKQRLQQQQQQKQRLKQQQQQQQRLQQQQLQQRLQQQQQQQQQQQRRHASKGLRRGRSRSGSFCRNKGFWSKKPQDDDVNFGEGEWDPEEGDSAGEWDMDEVDELFGADGMLGLDGGLEAFGHMQAVPTV